MSLAIARSAIDKNASRIRCALFCAPDHIDLSHERMTKVRIIKTIAPKAYFNTAGLFARLMKIILFGSLYADPKRNL